MKRQFISWGLMLAATFTLTNCAQEIENPAQDAPSAGFPFEITANTADTKTVNDGMDTKWVDKDQINLFHAVTDGTNYKSDGAFTVADTEEGRFTGELCEALNPQEEYDWYALYPYSTFITTPGAQTDGYTYIGGRSDTPQVQSGLNSMAHLAGTNYPLYGKAVATPANTMPSLTMNHAFAVLKVNVTNTLDVPLTVSSISFTAPEGTSLVGTFYLNVVGDEVDYADGNHVSNIANLSVIDAEIEAGASAAFYLAVKPFTAASGSELKVAVGDYEKPLTMPKDVEFAAGKIKTLNFSYNASEAPSGPEKLTVAEFANLEDGSDIYELTGTVTGIYQAYSSQYNNISFYLNDGTGEITIYRMSCVGLENPESISAGDVITVQGTKGNYNGTPQMAQGGICVSHQNACEAPVIVCEDNKVTITAEAGATIYYTTTGDDPTAESSVYDGTFDISATVTVKAIAVVEGRPSSSVASKLCSYLDPNGGEIAESVTLTVDMDEYVKDNNCTISSGSDVTNYKTLNLDDNISMVAGGTGTNEGSFWSGVQWRLYQSGNGKVTVSAVDGYIINSVKFVYSINNSGVLMNGSTNVTSGTELEVNDSSVTLVVGNTGGKTNGQVRITDVTVVYIAQ